MQTDEPINTAWGRVWRFLFVAAAIVGAVDMFRLWMRIEEMHRNVSGLAHLAVSTIGTNRLLATGAMWLVVLGLLALFCKLTPPRRRSLPVYRGPSTQDTTGALVISLVALVVIVGVAAVAWPVVSVTLAPYLVTLR